MGLLTQRSARDRSSGIGALDDWIAFLEEHKIPGGSLAVVRDGQLVYSRGFG